MTDAVYSEHLSTTSATKVSSDIDSHSISSSSLQLPSITSSMETSILTSTGGVPLPAVSINTSSNTDIPSTVTTSAAAATAALLANSSLSSFRQLAELWHPHVYNSAAKRPTPFSIEDILQDRAEQGKSNLQSRLELYGAGISNMFNQLNFQNLRYGMSDSNPSAGLLPELTSALAQHMVASSVKLHQSYHHSELSEENETHNLSPDNKESSISLPPPPPLIPTTKTMSVFENPNCDQPLNLTTKKHKFMENGQRPFDISSIVKQDIGQRMKCAKRKKDSLGPSSLSNNDNNASINSDQFGEEDDEDRKRKKVRTTFTGRQIFELEKMFEDKKYLSSTERAEMARMLNVTEQQVKIWFQNRRTKWKKQENISNAEAAELMKAKTIKSPDRLGTTTSSFLTSINSSAMNDVAAGKANGCNAIVRDTSCTSPSMQMNVYKIQNGIEGAPHLSLPLKEAPSLAVSENNSLYGNTSPSHTSNSSPFIRSSSSNSNSSLTLSTNCVTGNVSHTVSSIMNPIDGNQDPICSSPVDSSSDLDYIPSDGQEGKGEEIDEDKELLSGTTILPESCNEKMEVHPHVKGELSDGQNRNRSNEDDMAMLSTTKADVQKVEAGIEIFEKEDVLKIHHITK